MKQWLFRLLVALMAMFATLAQAQTLSYNGIRPSVIIDVRTPAEFAASHIPSAINLPLDRLETGIHSVSGVSKQSPILLYCRSGRRSALAREMLIRQGYSNVSDAGGMTTLSSQLKTCYGTQC